MQERRYWVKVSSETFRFLREQPFAFIRLRRDGFQCVCFVLRLRIGNSMLFLPSGLANERARTAKRPRCVGKLACGWCFAPRLSSPLLCPRLLSNCRQMRRSTCLNWRSTFNADCAGNAARALRPASMQAGLLFSFVRFLMPFSCSQKTDLFSLLILLCRPTVWILRN